MTDKKEPEKKLLTGLEDLPRRQRPARSRHLSECYIFNYPDDDGAYCTCEDWSPEI